MNVILLRALRIVVRADADAARQRLFANLMTSRRGVRAVYGLHERLGAGSWPATLLVSLYGLAAFVRIPASARRGGVLALATHENARRLLGRLMSWIGERECSWFRANTKAALWSTPAIAGVVSSGRLGTVLRIIRAIDREHGFLVACRAAAAIAWYVRSLAAFRAARPDSVMVSSDTNPEEVSFVAAARRLCVPHVFAAHAYPTPYAPPLDYTLSILEGEAAVEARRHLGPVRGDVIFAGVEGETAPMHAHARLSAPNPVVGIFTPKAVSWPALATLIADCRDHVRASKIVIRWHPSMLEAPHHFDGGAIPIVETPREAELDDVARLCDWVVADENSNVHLPVLKLGIPTIALRRLGVHQSTRTDLYGFVAHGIVFPPVSSIREVKPEVVAAFFSSDWAARFARHDASYLRPIEAIAVDVRSAVLALGAPTARVNA